MYDMHYDLLTILYFNFVNDNKYSDLGNMIDSCRRIYQPNNIIGGIANLYFMGSKEMVDELDIGIGELKNPIKMFKMSVNFLNDLKELGIIPDTVDFTYEIEGCDFLKISDLEELYKNGLRLIAPVWNNENIYGSGNRTDKGLTPLGEELIKKAIDLKIAIDVSHANLNTFNDILDVIDEEKEKSPIVIATHSNIRSICARERNLTDEELIKLKKIGGYVSLFTNGSFISLENESLSYPEREKEFLKHLDYLINVIGFDKKKIMLSTDDMNFNPDTSYHNLEVFDLYNINKRLRQLLKEVYGKEFIDDILVNNPKNLILKLNKY